MKNENTVVDLPSALASDLKQVELKTEVKGRQTLNLINPDKVDIEDSNSRSLKTESEWMTTDEAAAYLRISAATLRNLSSNGKVIFHKFGRRNRYRLDDLRNLLLSKKRGGFYGY